MATASVCNQLLIVILTASALSVKFIIRQLLINSYLNAAAFNKALRMMSAALRLCFFLILLTASNSSAAKRISKR